MCIGICIPQIFEKSFKLKGNQKTMYSILVDLFRINLGMQQQPGYFV